MVRVLLDEDLDVRLRLHLGAGIEVETVGFRGWKGTKNGPLLRLAERDFDVLVTGDTKLALQQDLSRYDLGVVVLRPRSKALPDLLELVPEIESTVREIGPGQVVEIYPPAE